MAAPPDDPLPELSRRAARRPAVILDDDPTGTQTLRDVPVLTGWDAASIARHLRNGEPAIFLSTNSRSLGVSDAVAVTRDAARAARRAAAETGTPISLVSRSDSTLRGHFPAEVTALGARDARILLAPYFGQGGRITVDDVHLLERDGRRVPVAETEFAGDAAFGYRSSNLRDWLAEKYAAAKAPTPAVASLTLELVRGGGASAVADALWALPPGGVVIANAAVERDIEIVALGALLAEDAGLPLVARTAASYVRARAGRAPAPLLTSGELRTVGPGLVIVGSHVPTTTRQLEHLREALGGERLATHELAIGPILAGGEARASAIQAATGVVERALAARKIGMVSTERTRRATGMEGARAISSALVSVVEGIEGRPGWMLVKGGITSSDIASRALHMREARVAGQILPGVPVWISGAESRWPDLPLVVFPGNVGGPAALADAVTILSERPTIA